MPPTDPGSATGLILGHDPKPQLSTNKEIHRILTKIHPISGNLPDYDQNSEDLKIFQNPKRKTLTRYDNSLVCVSMQGFTAVSTSGAGHVLKLRYDFQFGIPRKQMLQFWPIYQY